MNVRLTNKLQEFWHEHGILPTYEEICEIMGWTSKNAAFKAIAKLIKSDHLAKHGSRIKPGINFWL